MSIRLTSLCFFLILLNSGYGQQDTLAKYGPGFRFKDGIYLDAGNFRDNCPVYAMDEVYNDKGTKRGELDPKEDFYVMPEDSLIKLPFDSIWGICENGQVFVQHNTAFDRLIVVGKLCHIIHREEVIDYNSNIGMGVSSVPVRREVQVEYLIDLDSEEKVTFTPENLLHHMQDDHVLYRSFAGLSKKDRRKSLYEFLHRYNNDNPIYFLISGCHIKKVP
jgi:hypothetical protein